jgi:hypothetical protein
MLYPFFLNKGAELAQVVTATCWLFIQDRIKRASPCQMFISLILIDERWDFRVFFLRVSNDIRPTKLEMSAFEVA